MFRRRPVWILLVILCAVCAVFALRLFPRAFPLLALDVAMDRTTAIRAARQLATAQHWGPDGETRDAATFGGNGHAQAFVELEGGGKTAFAALLQDDLYTPCAWHVRLFREAEEHQTVVWFKPGGAPFGFADTLRENAPGAALEPDAARQLAEAAAAAAPWRLPLARFTFIEKSQVVRPGGRVDHTFVYERPDRPLGEGRLRLKLVVSGDRLTELSHFLKIPEAFSRRYEQMRTTNNFIAGGASLVLTLVLLLGGCGVGLAYLIRQRAVQWRPAFVAAAALTGLQLAAGLNAWPLAWLHYDTALSSGSFTTQQLLGLLVAALAMGAVTFVSFIAAEGLSRRAFPQHPQFWRLWSPAAGATTAVLGRTLGGYLLTGVSLLYVTVFYYLALRLFGWWTPSDALVQPDALAHHWPALTPLARAAQAGFWEESLFRAVPLAGAALLGTRFGGRRWWLVGAFVLQALIFSAVHANYPGQPAYSRVVELLLPSCLFAALYLRFGLLPAVLLHFGYDVVLMSLPLFAASAPGLWLDRTLLVLAALLPFWIVLWRRARAGAWGQLPAALRNGGWQPAVDAPAIPVPAPASAPRAAVSVRLRMAVVGAGVLGLIAWYFTSPLRPVSAPLQLSRAEAIAAAQTELTRLHIRLPAGFRADASVPNRPWEADRFVWQTVDPQEYAALLGTYLPQPHWLVRFATFEGDVAERAEEWTVVLTGDGRVQKVAHRLPEARAGATLTEAEARTRVHAGVREKWHLDPGALVEVSATSAKRPHRLDWTFVFKDPAVKSLAPGEARLRVVLSGDEITDAGRFVFAPETWERADRAKQSYFQIGGVVKNVATAVLLLSGIGAAVVAWSRGRLNLRVAVPVFIVLATAGLVGQANQWPAIRAGFVTARPLSLQQTMAIVAPLVGIPIGSAALALVAGFAARWLRPPLPQPAQALTLGLGLGAALTGAFGVAALLRFTGAPPWPGFGAAATYAPWIATLCSAVFPIVTQSALLLLSLGWLDRFTAGWQRRPIAGAALLFVVSGVLLVPWGAASVGLWLGLTAANALIATLGCLLVLRRDLTLTPLVVGTTSALGILANGLPQVYPGALPAAIFASLLGLAGGWAATRGLRQIAGATAAA